MDMYSIIPINATPYKLTTRKLGVCALIRVRLITYGVKEKQGPERFLDAAIASL